MTLFLCASLSACTAVSGGGGGASPLRPTVRPGTTASGTDLGGAALAARDVDGLTVSEADGRPEVRVALPACAPLAYALSGEAVGDPTATVEHRLSGDGATVTAILAEYPSGRAPTAMDALGTALDECADGFTTTVDGEEHKVGDVVPQLVPEGVEQAMGWQATVNRAGRSVPVKTVVLRVGDTVAYLSGTPALPAAVLQAQMTKLS
ncbi:hypothetical protein GCM10023220_51160 [Streptomyces ziwulingensis]|uniref:Lipoprotein n=1 Tax=Streptomyces ziwulingensis TaxID=1045501 RepID=A0ABP9CPQ9_9ACTN